MRVVGDSSKGSFSAFPLGFLLAFSTGSVGAHVLLFFFRPAYSECEWCRI